MTAEQAAHERYCEQANIQMMRKQVIKAVQRATRALDKQHKKLRQQAAAYLERIGVPAGHGPSGGTARLAYEGVQAQLDVIKRLRDLHLAELKAEVAQSELVRPCTCFTCLPLALACSCLARSQQSKCQVKAPGRLTGANLSKAILQPHIPSKCLAWGPHSTCRA